MKDVERVMASDPIPPTGIKTVHEFFETDQRL
jgi:hypothetical protein